MLPSCKSVTDKIVYVCVCVTPYVCPCEQAESLMQGRGRGFLQVNIKETMKFFRGGILEVVMWEKSDTA